MSYSCRILADSFSDNAIRLTTFEITFPRFILAELNTHRVFSRNSSSSRAIPLSITIKRVQDDPFVPDYWGKNQKGMQASEELDPLLRPAAASTWLAARSAMVYYASSLAGMGVHKQIANRLLEPFMWQTALVSATEWENFFNLRTHKGAQPEFRRIATMMRDMYNAGDPEYLKPGQWHLPLLPDKAELISDGYCLDDLIRISTGRCARVSYLTHDGVRDPNADIELCGRLVKDGHMSPLEHPAYATSSTKMMGNFRGFVQYRKLIPGESVYRP